jgi:hypothetical protein
MQKRDLFNHIGNFEKWVEGLTPKYIEEGLTKINSKIFVDYIVYLGETKSKGHAHRNKTKLRTILKGLQDKGVNDISKLKEKDVYDFFIEWSKTHSADYVKRFTAFWNWWRKTNRKEGIVVQEIKLEIKDFQNGKSRESNFVWLNKEEFDKFRSYFDEDKQTILLFCFDSIIRSPTELQSLRVENIFQKNGEVWVDIPKEISKTIGRKFNLVYSGELVLKYIEQQKKKPEDYLFSFSSVTFNDEMQRVAKQIFKDKKSGGGDYYKNITMYDLRHSGAIHFRELFQKTGQSLDLLRERGGWTNFKMIDYYTKRLGLTGHIQKEKLLLEEDKTNLEKEVNKQNNKLKILAEAVELLALNKTQKPVKRTFKQNEKEIILEVDENISKVYNLLKK